MEIKITKISPEEQEFVDIRCIEETNEVRDIALFVRSRNGSITGTADGRQYEIPFSEILYIESVDNRTFVYTSDMTYEVRHRIYEFEEILRNRQFLRISRSSILNLMKIQSVRPALNGRFSALLVNGEQIIISRKYVSELKKTLKGE